MPPERKSSGGIVIFPRFLPWKIDPFLKDKFGLQLFQMRQLAGIVVDFYTIKCLLGRKMADCSIFFDQIPLMRIRLG